MALGFIPEQGKLGSIANESQRVANDDLGEGEQPTGEDHFAHATGKTCKACGRTIEAGQTARRRGETDWVHDVCPVVTD